MSEIATIDWFGKWGTSDFSKNTAMSSPCYLLATQQVAL